MTLSSIYFQFQFCGENLINRLAFENKVNIFDTELSQAPSAYRDAVYGYAFGKHVEEVNQLLKKNDSLLPEAVMGYARGGALKEADKLISNCKQNKDAALKAKIFGMAQAGNTLQVNIALHTSSEKYLLPAILGYASANLKEPLFNLLEGTRYYGDAIKEAAKNGHSALVEELLTACGINCNESAAKDTLNAVEEIAIQRMLNKALIGYTQGCHFADAGKMIALGANPVHAVSELENMPGSKTEAIALFTKRIPNKQMYSKTVNELQKRSFDFKETFFKSNHTPKDAEKIDLEKLQSDFLQLFPDKNAGIENRNTQ